METMTKESTMDEMPMANNFSFGTMSVENKEERLKNQILKMIDDEISMSKYKLSLADAKVRESRRNGDCYPQIAKFEKDADIIDAKLEVLTEMRKSVENIHTPT